MKTDCKEIDFQKHTNVTDDILQMGIHSRYVTFKNVTFVITKLFYYYLITNFRDNGWSDDDGDYNFDKRHEELPHTEIIDRCKFNHGHLINARLSLNRSLLQEEMLTVNNTKMQDLNPTGTDNINLTQKINKTYSTMLKFISGALVGGAKYSNIYLTSDDEDDDISRTSENKTNTSSLGSESLSLNSS